MSNLATRLYNGEAGIDVVGRRKIWYSIAAVIVVVAALSFAFKGFKLGIDFEGGNSFQVPVSVGSLEEARGAVADAGAEVVTAQQVGTGGNATYLIKTADLEADKAQEVKEAIAAELGLTPEQVSDNRVSASWGAQILQQALIGVLIFLVLVVVYLIAVFREWRMAFAAIAALVQNLLLTAAIYILIGFEVSPSTVIGFLTILGFALYDVVVVFDKVRENTRGITGKPDQTYGEAANLAVNQTIMRSINTAVVALLPVGGLLFIGAGLLKAGTLKDLGLVLFVGMLAAVYSSIFFATPVLVDLKEREPRFKAHKQRVLARRAAGASAAKAKVARTADTDEEAPATPTVAAPGVLASASPRPGARPGQRKRPGGAKPGSKAGGAKRR
ncbi:protein translocase subunit SecF [Luedemannella helvata]|uniref:Protein-export membrane protein SecF n=1 Tax=Luedemannella helvata TaxID=349315 RepID=A0ABP4WL06_9ACTN